jgi:predicted ferric reductase
MTVTTRPPSTAAPRLSPALGTTQTRASAVMAVIAAGALGVLLLWWHDTLTINGFGDWLTNAGRVTGLLAGYAVAVLLVLMARAPWLERGIGADALARWHAAGGRYTVSLVVAHALLITWGYAVTAHTDVVAQTGTLISSYPDVLMATVAGLLLVGVGISSARAARKRLRYETWYFLHFYTYLAVALGFSHQFATGADFVNNANARVAWSTMYIAVAALLVWYRIITPIRTSLRHRMRVAEVRTEAPGVVSIILRGDHLAELKVEAGQFFRWRFLTRDGWWQSHPYSLSAPPHEHYLRITIKDLGDHSRELQHVRVGTTVFAEGPYGALTASRRRRRKVLLLAGGVGITPLRALFEALPASNGDLTMVVRANHEREVVFREELDEIARRRGARVHYAIGLPGKAGDPFVGRRLRQLVPDVAKHDVYLCGPPAFMTVAAQSVRASGVPARHLHTESFSF